MMADLTIECIQCRRAFVFKRDEQERFIQRGFELPKRCSDCRKKKVKVPEEHREWKNMGRKRPFWRKAAHRNARSHLIEYG
jgi:hypothetical protein